MFNSKCGNHFYVVPEVEDINIEIGVKFCTLGITLLMIYGAIRGKSLYLMPFFCLQAFEFFVNR